LAGLCLACHLVVIHPGHLATAFLGRFLLVAVGFTLLMTAVASAGSRQDGYRQKQYGQPRILQNRLQDNPLFHVV
jgi:hypothetical protein